MSETKSKTAEDNKTATSNKTADAKKKPSTIFVKSLLPIKADGGSELAFYELSEDHPDGEAFVAGNEVVEVGLTTAVQAAITARRIERVNPPE